MDAIAGYCTSSCLPHVPVHRPVRKRAVSSASSSNRPPSSLSSSLSAKASASSSPLPWKFTRQESMTARLNDDVSCLSSTDALETAENQPPSPKTSSAAEVPPRVLQSVLIACCGAFAFGYHISVVNGGLPYILADIGATGSSLVGGWIVSISLASAAVGALLGGVLADSLGRRKALLANCIPFIVGSAISATAASVPQMLFGRAIVGGSFGIVSSVVPLYISEVSPPSVRGTYGSYNQLTICIGIVGALLAGLPLASSAGWWRSMFWIGALPAVLQAAGLLAWAPETPEWLKKKGRLAEAQQAEAILAGKSVQPASLGRKAGSLREDLQDTLLEREVGMGELFSSKYRKVVGLGMLIFAIQQFAGINAVVYYSSSVFQRVGITSDIAASALVASANVLGTLISSQLVDTQGRKKLLISSFTGMGLSMLLLALTLTLPALQPFAGVLSVLGTVAYVLSFAFGVGPVPALLLPEIFPAAIRANAIAVSLMSHWVCNFVIGLTFLSVVEAIGVAGAYTVFSIVCFLGLAFVHYVLPETKGRSLEEIEALFITPQDKDH